MSPKLIIINGLPATGKTTLAKQISDATGIKCIGKDDIKELLFDKFDYKKRQDSQFLGAIAMEVLYSISEQFLKANKSIIIEAPFSAEHSKKRYKSLTKKLSIEIIEIYCSTDPELIKQRIIKRDKSGQRHPGHIRPEDYELDFYGEAKKHKPLRIGKLIKVDTTNPKNINILEIISSINQLK